MSRKIKKRATESGRPSQGEKRIGQKERLLVGSKAGAKNNGMPKSRDSSVVVVIFASGYPKMDDAEVIRRFKEKIKVTAVTKNFGKTATSTRGYPKTIPDKFPRVEIKPASSVNHFLGTLQQHAKHNEVLGNIKRVIFIGHGSERGIEFAPGELLGIDELDDPSKQAVIKQIIPVLTDDATIDLYACNSGINPQFTSALANAFQRDVKSWKEPLVWCITHDGHKVDYTGLMMPAPKEDGTKIDCSTKAGKRQFKSIAQLVPPNTTAPTNRQVHDSH